MPSYVNAEYPACERSGRPSQQQGEPIAAPMEWFVTMILNDLLFISNHGQYRHNGTYKSYISYYKNTGTINKPTFTLVNADLNNIAFFKENIAS